ncbi:tRNA (adenosine(37)-N6)-dimethylallyltransferase MiaA [Paenibacillus yanchengensis]|uniref:tRNA dimethylallyltransferase n=1 Tax=Paenibacillus yanchengensis TaxID=2035833 RepID=A0ABW4YKA3_9BACL
MIRASKWNYSEVNSGVRKQPLLVLLGPTAVGKTKLSIELAKVWNAEIISGDSMQVYRGMDIGTAKINATEMENIPHHLIDICDPQVAYSAAEFQADAKQLIQEISDRSQLPFIVGGTGLYIESLLYEYRFASIGEDEQFRVMQENYAATNGNTALHAKLAIIDEEAAERLHPNDTRRVIRALEVYHLTGQTFSEQQKNQLKQSPYELCIIGLSVNRALLYERIEQRIDQMMEEGLLEEVKALLALDPPPHNVPLQALGYKEMAMHLRGELTLEEAVQLLKRDTRRFAKRQLSWFRHMSEIQWIDMEQNFNNNLQAIHGIIAGKFDYYREYK